jgi:hypothetical protein
MLLYFFVEYREVIFIFLIHILNQNTKNFIIFTKQNYQKKIIFSIWLYYIKECKNIFVIFHKKNKIRFLHMKIDDSAFCVVSDSIFHFKFPEEYSTLGFRFLGILKNNEKKLII